MNTNTVNEKERQFLLGKSSKLSFGNKLTHNELLELSAHIKDQSEFLHSAVKDKRTVHEQEERETSVATYADYGMRIPDRSEHKTVIIGSGPAAFTAAIYAARANLRPIVFIGNSEDTPGGQLMTTTEIENYPGFVTGVHGQKLMTRMKEQAQRAGSTIIYARIEAVNLTITPKRLYYNQDNIIKTVLADTVIIATGANANKDNSIPGAIEYWSNGVSACAVCDGPLPIYKNKELIVIGGGDTACEEATYLTNIATKVYLIVRRREKEMRASKTMVARVKNNPKIVIKDNCIVKRISGTVDSDGKPDKVTGAILLNLSTGKEELLPVGGIFFAIGHTPNTQFLSNCVEDDGKVVKLLTSTKPPEIRIAPDGYLLAVKGSTQCLKPKPYVEPESSLANERILTEEIFSAVFASGDCQDKVYRQAVTACGTGCMAALEAERYLGQVEAAHVAAEKTNKH